MSFFHALLAAGPVNQGILWDDGDEILWDDATPLLWDNTFWILRTGGWNDNGVWEDNNIWID